MKSNVLVRIVENKLLLLFAHIIGAVIGFYVPGQLVGGWSPLSAYLLDNPPC